MILNTTGAQVTMNLTASQLGIVSPVTMDISTLTLPDSALSVGLIGLGGIIFLIVLGQKLVKG